MKNFKRIEKKYTLKEKIKKLEKLANYYINKYYKAFKELA